MSRRNILTGLAFAAYCALSMFVYLKTALPDRVEGLHWSSFGSPCAGIEAAIVIPTIKKGLNNQRLRIIQDIAVALSFRKRAFVVLPSTVTSRRNCHYSVGCYTNYSHHVPIWQVFDRESTLGNLADLGVCVLPEGAAFNKKKLSMGSAKEFPAIHNSASGYEAQSVPPGVWHLLEVCCTRFIPDTERAEGIMLRVNAAFRASKMFRDQVAGIEGKMRHVSQARETPGKWIAMHWRGESDMSNSSHELDPIRYERAIIQKLMLVARSEFGAEEARRGRTLLPIFVCGDSVPLKGLEETFNARLSGAGAPRVRVKLYSKGSLFPDVDYDKMFDSMEDIKGELDFEIGVQSPVFIGSPFSSFSAVVALSRTSATGDQGSPTYMISAEVADNLARIFAAQLPYKVADGRTPFGGKARRKKDRCREFTRYHPRGPQCN